MSLDAIGIASKDIQESVRFYELLGVTLEETGGPDHYEGTTKSGVRIMLDSVMLAKQIRPDWKEPVGSSVTLAFLQESPAEVDKMFSRIKEAGFTTIRDPWDAFWNQRYAYIQGPDGNTIALFADM